MASQTSLANIDLNRVHKYLLIFVCHKASPCEKENLLYSIIDQIEQIANHYTSIRWLNIVVINLLEEVFRISEVLQPNSHFKVSAFIFFFIAITKTLSFRILLTYFCGFPVDIFIEIFCVFIPNTQPRVLADEECTLLLLLSIAVLPRCKSSLTVTLLPIFTKFRHKQLTVSSQTCASVMLRQMSF